MGKGFGACVPDADLLLLHDCRRLSCHREDMDHLDCGCLVHHLTVALQPAYLPGPLRVPEPHRVSCLYAPLCPKPALPVMPGLWNCCQSHVCLLPYSALADHLCRVESLFHLSSPGLDPESEVSRRGQGWARWHAESLLPQRRALTSRKLLLVLGQKTVPRLCVFAAATAALHIEPTGDGTQLSYAFFRTWITGLSACLWFIITLIYAQLAYPRFLREFFANWRVSQALYLWALRAATVCVYVYMVWHVFGSYMSRLTLVDPIYGTQTPPKLSGYSSCSCPRLSRCSPRHYSFRSPPSAHPQVTRLTTTIRRRHLSQPLPSRSCWCRRVPSSLHRLAAGACCPRRSFAACAATRIRGTVRPT